MANMNWTDTVAIIIIILAIIWLIFTVWRNFKIRRIENWPTTTATVINSAAKTETTSTTKSSIFPTHQSINLDQYSNTQYHLIITYKYTVNGIEYQSRNINYGSERVYDALNMKNLLMQLSPGAQFTVYYNPGNPSEAYIFSGDMSYTGMVLSLIAIAVAGLFIFYNHSGDETKSPESEPEKENKITISTGGWKPTQFH